MVGWPVSASRRSMEGVGAATVTALMEHHQQSFSDRVELRTYPNGFVDGLVIGFADSICRIWRFNVCITTQLPAI